MVQDALERVEYRLAPSLDEVGAAVGAILDHARDWGLVGEAPEGDLRLALDEALANAVFHGALLIGPEFREQGFGAWLGEASAGEARSPYAEHRIHVLVDHLADAVRITIDDGGPGFDVSRTPESVGPDATGGRGLMLMRSCMDAVQHNASGNQVTILKRF